MSGWINRLFKSIRTAAAGAARWFTHIFDSEQRQLARTRVYWDDAAAMTLSNLVQQTETKASGRVQVISLGEFREAIGELWEKYESRILIIAESTIARMIGRGNTFIPQGEAAWLLLYPELSEDKAQDATDAIASRIGEKLMGARFTAHELPLPSAAKLDLSNAVNADGSLNMEAVKAAVSRVRQTQIKAVANSRPAPARPQPTKPPPSVATQMQVLFRPAWSADTENIDSFFFRAFTDTGVNVYASSAAPIGDQTLVELTNLAAGSFAGMCAANVRAKYTLPVPFGSLHGPARAEIQRIVSVLPQRQRLLLLRIEIVRIPHDAPADMLVAMRELFRPYVRDVALAMDLYAPNEQALALDHVMVGADVTEQNARSDDELHQAMILFRQRAGQRGTYLLGLNSRAQAAHAISAGFSEVGGAGIANDLKRLPDRVAALRRNSLVSP